MASFQRLLCVFSFCILGCFSIVKAQEVVLNPGFISGTIKIGDEVFDNNVGMRAVFGSFLSEVIIQPTSNQSEYTYTLTVNVPEGTTSEYSVNNFTTIVTDDGFDRFNFLSKKVLVNEFETSQLDFILENDDIGSVEGVVTVEGEGVLVSANITVGGNISDVSEETALVTTITQTTPERSGAFKIVALPGERGVTCRGVVSVQGQELNSVGDPQLITVVAGDTIIVNCVLQTPVLPDRGGLGGQISVNNDDPRRHIVTLIGPLSDPINPLIEESVFLNNGDGTYLFQNRLFGNHRLQVETFFNFGQQYLQFPFTSFNPMPDVSNNYQISDVETNVDIVTSPGFLQGNLNITGIDNSVNVSSVKISAIGLKNNVFNNGEAYHQIPLPSDSSLVFPYKLILSEGDWRLRHIDLRFGRTATDPDEAFVSFVRSLSFAGMELPRTVSSNDSTFEDFNIELGEVVVKYKITDSDLTLSNPTLGRLCILRDVNGELIHSYSVLASNPFQQNVQEGQVRFFGLEGTCDLSASATVNGSNTSFGDFTVNVVPGATTVIDIDGPRISVQSPEPEALVAGETIDVTGLATDDIGVESLTVNGVDAILESTNNEDDPNEMSFTATIPIVLGPNEIKTEASDAEGNIGSDTRTVYRDDEEPTVVWTPASDTQIASEGSTTLVQVSGTADDDSGVLSITVEGVLVDFVSTNNPDNPNEVSFITNLDLVDGDNFIDVVVKDVSMREVMQTHRVEVTTIDDEAPTVFWSPDDNRVIVSATEITPIEVRGIASDNIGVESITVEGVPVNFEVVTSRPDLSNPVEFSTTIDLVGGDNFIDVVVTDVNGNQVTDTHRVEINRRPIANAGPDQVVEQQSPEGAIVTLDGSASFDPDGDEITFFNWLLGRTFLGTEQVISVVLPSGINSVNLTVVSDTSSNIDTVVITVQDTTAPVLTVPSDIEIEATGELTVVDIGTATATDAADLDVSISNNAPQSFPLGETVVTWTATDDAGNSSTATQTITVTEPVDETPPVITVPADIEVEATGKLTVVDIGQATATDDRDGTVEITNDAPAEFQLGETVVTWSAVDSSGNTATATQLVTVVDTTAPEFNVNKIREVLYKHGHHHKHFKLAAVVSDINDLVDDAPNVDITVTGNQPKHHKNKWHKRSHWYKWYHWKRKQNYKIVARGDEWKVKLKPEINRYSEQPGVYTITVTVTDESGNSKTVTCNVEVKKPRYGYGYKKHHYYHHAYYKKPRKYSWGWNTKSWW